MINKFYSLFILVVCVLASFGCEKQNNEHLESMAVIGIHPCTASATFNKGYVIKLGSTGDTVLTFNLPQEIRAQIDGSVNELIGGYLFPSSKVFNFNLSYRLATSTEMVFPICLANIDTSEISKIKKQIVMSYDTKTENVCPEINFLAINFGSECSVSIDDEKVEDKFLVINSKEELSEHIKYSPNGCNLLKDQLDIDFSKYTLLIGKKKLNSVQGKLISQAINKDCYSEKYIYKLSIKNGGYTALGNFIYGIIIQKINTNAIVEPEISVLD